MTRNEPTVLVVDDEPKVTDTYARKLEDSYFVLKAYDGYEALEVIDDDVDVVLLDRRMPELSGDEVLEEIRDRDLECWVAMLTAVEPDFDIIDMEFDDYLVKPVSKGDLHDAVEHLLARADYTLQVREYFSVSSKLAVLEAEKTDEELAESDEYTDLRKEMEDLREQINETLDELGDEEFVKAFRDISRNP